MQVFDFKGIMAMPCFKAKLNFSLRIKHFRERLKSSSQSCPQFAGVTVQMQARKAENPAVPFFYAGEICS
jgi:hypothetical protein